MFFFFSSPQLNLVGISRLFLLTTTLSHSAIAPLSRSFFFSHSSSFVLVNPRPVLFECAIRAVFFVEKTTITLVGRSVELRRGSVWVERRFAIAGVVPCSTITHQVWDSLAPPCRLQRVLSPPSGRVALFVFERPTLFRERKVAFSLLFVYLCKSARAPTKEATRYGEGRTTARALAGTYAAFLSPFFFFSLSNHDPAVVSFFVSSCNS